MSTCGRSLPVLVLALTLTAGPAYGRAAPTIPEIARHLAENVLGEGLVQSVHVEAETLRMRWESATYRPVHDRKRTRELLFGEAELATGSVLGRLSGIKAVHFVINARGKLLAQGVNARGSGTAITYAAHLGGGQYVHPQPIQIPGKVKKRPGSQI